MFAEHESVIVGDPFTFEDLFSSQYKVKSFDATWVKGWYRDTVAKFERPSLSALKLVGSLMRHMITVLTVVSRLQVALGEIQHFSHKNHI